MHFICKFYLPTFPYAFLAFQNSKYFVLIAYYIKINKNLPFKIIGWDIKEHRKVSNTWFRLLTT